MDLVTHSLVWTLQLGGLRSGATDVDLVTHALYSRLHAGADSLEPWILHVVSHCLVRNKSYRRLYNVNVVSESIGQELFRPKY